jgi:hypothetical protein
MKEKVPVENISVAVYMEKSRDESFLNCFGYGSAVDLLLNPVLVRHSECRSGSRCKINRN